MLYEEQWVELKMINLEKSKISSIGEGCPRHCQVERDYPSFLEDMMRHKEKLSSRETENVPGRW